LSNQPAICLAGPQLSGKGGNALSSRRNLSKFSLDRLRRQHHRHYFLRL
jgi:hypothetical protein